MRYARPLIVALSMALGLFAHSSLAASGPAPGPFHFQTFDGPQRGLAEAHGISGNVVVGEYGWASFIYDGSTFKTFNAPPAGHFITRAFGISDGTIVGDYSPVTDASRSHGFVYTGSTFTTLDYPSAMSTSARAISGNTIVGTYENSDGISHGFSYDGSKFTPLDIPFGTTGTIPLGISGNTIVGEYVGTDRGFIYDGERFKFFDVGIPAAIPVAISGQLIIGKYRDGNSGWHGFVYDGSTLTTLDGPGGGDFTYPGGISGTTVVGSYADQTGTHSFIVTVPEPNALIILCLCGVALVRRHGMG